MRTDCEHDPEDDPGEYVVHIEFEADDDLTACRIADAIAAAASVHYGEITSTLTKDGDWAKHVEAYGFEDSDAKPDYRAKLRSILDIRLGRPTAGCPLGCVGGHMNQAEYDDAHRNDEGGY